MGGRTDRASGGPRRHGNGAWAGRWFARSMAGLAVGAELKSATSAMFVIIDVRVGNVFVILDGYVYKPRAA